MSLPAMHPSKRRRLDQSTSTLAKPFRSPLRVDPNKQLQSDSHNNKQQQVVHAQAIPQPFEKPLSSSPSMRPPSPAMDGTLSPTRRTPLTSPTRPSTRDSEYVALQKQHSALSLQLTKLRQQLDTAQQALKIEQSNQDTELEALIEKWKGVARELAEELFSTAKDRVNKMGGLGAWRERTQKDPNWGDEPDMDESELTLEQREQLEIQREEIVAEAEKYGVKEPEPEPKDDDVGLPSKHLFPLCALIYVHLDFHDGYDA